MRQAAIIQYMYHRHICKHECTYIFAKWVEIHFRIDYIKNIYIYISAYLCGFIPDIRLLHSREKKNNGYLMPMIAEMIFSTKIEMGRFRSQFKTSEEKKSNQFIRF